MEEIIIGQEISPDSGVLNFLKQPSLEDTPSVDYYSPELYPNNSDLAISIHNTKIDAHQDKFLKLEENINAELAKKVNAEDGKGLSENDFTTDLKTFYDGACANSHIHENKNLLDSFLDSGIGDKFLSDDGQYKLIDVNNFTNKDLQNVTTNAKENLNLAGVRTVVETYVNGTYWYRKYSDGWIEQGGSTTFPNNFAAQNLVIPFKNTNYNIFVQYIGESNTTFGGAVGVVIRAYTTTQFLRAMYGASTNPPGLWHACGY